MTTLIPVSNCPRCQGKGKISAFANVLGGVCFRCQGGGKVKTGASRKSFQFVLVFDNRITGTKDRIYSVAARNSAQALRIASVRYENASASFKDTYTMEGAAAVREDELSDDVRGDEED